MDRNTNYNRTNTAQTENAREIFIERIELPSGNPLFSHFYKYHCIRATMITFREIDDWHIYQNRESRSQVRARILVHAYSYTYVEAFARVQIRFAACILCASIRWRALAGFRGISDSPGIFFSVGLHQLGEDGHDGGDEAAGSKSPGSNIVGEREEDQRSRACEAEEENVRQRHLF